MQTARLRIAWYSTALHRIRLPWADGETWDGRGVAWGEKVLHDAIERRDMSDFVGKGYLGHSDGERKLQFKLLWYVTRSSQSPVDALSRTISSVSCWEAQHLPYCPLPDPYQLYHRPATECR